MEPETILSKHALEPVHFRGRWTWFESYTRLNHKSHTLMESIHQSPALQIDTTLCDNTLSTDITDIETPRLVRASIMYLMEVVPSGTACVNALGVWLWRAVLQCPVHLIFAWSFIYVDLKLISDWPIRPQFASFPSAYHWTLLSQPHSLIRIKKMPQGFICI